MLSKLIKYGTAAFIVGIGVLVAWMGRQFAPKHRYLPWHETPQWKKFLAVYDRMADSYFSDCMSNLVTTDFGLTQAYSCGNPHHPPALFLHGAGSNALIYGPWLMPAVRQTHYSVIVDYPCDTGRSIPPEGDPNRCPNTEVEMATWVEQVLTEFQLQNATLVGYSYGAALSILTAIHKPHIVNQLVLLAPAAVLDELSLGFAWHAVVLALFRGDWGQNYFLKWVSAFTNYSLETVPIHEHEQLVAIREVAGTVLSVPAPVLNDTMLSAIFSRHRTFVGMGQEEKLYKNATLAIERARSNGAHTVKGYPNAGHLMLLEAGDSITNDVVAFLNPATPNVDE